jgi:arylsulfatase A-like enzyme
MDFIKRVLAGCVGGFIGGAIVGVDEAIIVAAVSDLTEFWALWFGAISYGFFGAVMGAGWGFATLVTGAIFSRLKELPTVMGSAAGIVVALLGMVVGRFRIIRDVFSESLAIGSTQGIIVHVGLIVFGIVAFFAVTRWMSASVEKRGAVAAGGLWAGVVLGFALVASFALTAVAGGEDAADPGQATADGPNVLLFIADTTRADHLGPYGASDVKTPALDQLAADSVVFQNAFAHSSWTRPSIATILTSLYASSHQVMHKTDLLPDDVVTIAESMKDGGYRTSGFVTNINVAPSFNFQQGFDSYRYLSPSFFFGATDSGSKLSLYSGMRLIRERFLSKTKFVENYYQDGVTVNARAVPWLETNGSEPFFTLVHYMDPHDPYFEIPYNGKAVARVEEPHPDGARAKELRDLYIANIEYLDQFIGQVLDQLRTAGVYDDTVIAFVSDHGEEFYEHEGWWHGTTLYDEQIHVPLILKRAKNVGAGGRVSDLVGMIDVMPTLLAAAGVEVPSSAQGRDLFGATTAPTAVYAEEDHEGNILESIRSSEWKLIIANEGNPRGVESLELYNVAADPGETNNLASSKSDVVGRLQNELETLRSLAGASAVTGSTGALDAADEERLRALGYLD